MMDTTDNLTLAELMQDPLVHLMMRSDGIDQSSVEALFARIAQSRRRAHSARRAKLANRI